MATNAVVGSPMTATVERKKARPIVGWAVLGALALGCEIYLLASWILAGEAVRQPVGETPVPTYIKVSLDILQVAFPIAFAASIYFLLVKPLVRERRVTTDGLFALVFALIWWQDPLADFMGPWSIYNTYPVNFGNWLGRVPGTPFPQASKLAEPLLLSPPSYLAGVFIMVVVANVGMRRAQMRWPKLSNFWLITCTYIFFFVFDIIVEVFLIAIGWYTYPGTVKGLTLFPNQYIRFPIYEAVIMSATWTLFACLRYFKNDKGETIAERGSEQLRSSGKKKTVIRFLALNGICNVLYFVSYNIPTQYFAVNMETFPSAITSRSYFLGGLCGEGTTYMCPGSEVPIPRGDSARVGPDGQLVPAGEPQVPRSEVTTTTTSTVNGSR